MKKFKLSIILIISISLFTACSKPKPSAKATKVDMGGVYSYIFGTYKNADSIIATTEDGDRSKAELVNGEFMVSVRPVENAQSVELEVTKDGNKTTKNVDLPGLQPLKEYNSFKNGFNMRINEYNENAKTTFPQEPEGGTSIVSQENGVESSVNIAGENLIGLQFRSKGDANKELATCIVATAYTLDAFDDKISDAFNNMLSSKKSTKLTVNGITYKFDYNDGIYYAEIYKE